MYNPVGGERYEYIELANLGEIDADLSGAYFDGIDFRFPRDTQLATGRGDGAGLRFQAFP